MIQNQDKQESLKYLKRSADAGIPSAMYLFAQKSVGSERVAYMKKAAQKLAIAQYTYSKMISQGEAPGTQAEADEYMNMSINNGCEAAKYETGIKSLPSTSGVELIKDSAAKGYPPALSTLGILMLEGTIVEKNIEDAVKLIRAAAMDGYPEAMYHYSKILAEGTMVEKNVELANEILKRAEENGYKPR